jgi:putative redox protein
VKWWSFRLDVDAVSAETHPKIYEKITIGYHFEGKGIDREKVEQAVELSLGKYCPVSAMLAKVAEIEHEITIDSEKD